MGGGRSESSGDYRYGFNGKEKDSNGEWGSQTHYDYGFRIYNPGIGKFLSVDPLTPSYPELTPYQFASNTPIVAIDLDGLEAYYSTDGKFLRQYGESTEIRITSAKTFYDVNYMNLDDPEAQAKALNDPKKSRKAYTNPDQAALDFAYEYNGKAHLENTQAYFTKWKKDSGRYFKEYGAAIGSKEVTDQNGETLTLYILGKTMFDEKAAVDIMGSEVPVGWKITHGVHTHPIRNRYGNKDDSGEEFSGYKNKDNPIYDEYGDKHLARKNDIYLYLATPNGYLKVFYYDTKNKKEYIEIIDDNIPNHPYSGRKRSLKQKPSYSERFDKNGDPIRKPIEYEAPELEDKSKNN